MKKNKKNGFTILELIAAVAIFIFICVSAISMIILGIKYNTVNRETYNSDLISKAFVESIESNENRPIAQKKDASGNVIEGLPDGKYIAFLGDSSSNYNYTVEVEEYVKNNFSKKLGLLSPSNDPNTQFSALMQEAKTKGAGKKFALVTKLKSRDSGKAYEIEIWCWDIKRGDMSVVNRKKVINSMM